MATAKHTWRTVWQGQAIVVLRDEVEVDRLPADRIARVVFVCRGDGDSPGDIERTVVELGDEGGYWVFEAETGFAGRVNFERQAFWAERGLVHWVGVADAAWPWRLRLRTLGAREAMRRLPRGDLEGVLDQWPLVGPQTWDERKQRRIDKHRPFGHVRAVP